MSEINKGFSLWTLNKFFMNGCCSCFNYHFDLHVRVCTLLRSTNYSGNKFVWKSLSKKVLDQEDTLGSKSPLYKKLAVNFERNTASTTAAGGGFWKWLEDRIGQVSKWLLLSNFVCLQLVFATTPWTNVHELGWTCSWQITFNQINAVCSRTVHNYAGDN